MFDAYLKFSTWKLNLDNATTEVKDKKNRKGLLTFSSTNFD